MRNIIVGTAGHIDHGKTALIKALTGTDADRLDEEKRRGITIDLGFAHLQLAKDLRIGFIDVPGHERFVRNMLAGAAGIDVVLFVISAAESIKPQTREHFEICRMLGVRSGIIALTKADLVDPEILDLVRLEVEEFTADSFLADAPKIAVSANTGQGLSELRSALETAAHATREKSAGGYFRLPIDRVFTMKGFGTVVTGTMISGTLTRDQEVELFPAGRRLRVRGIQVYGEPTDRARAGERTAVNLAGIEPHELHRGMVLTEPGRFTAVSILDCELESFAPIKNRAPVHFHSGTAEIEGEVRKNRIVLREPALILPGDRFIIRRFSPVTTIGGGRVADISGPRKARTAEFKPETLISERPYGLSEEQFIAWTGVKVIPAYPDVERAGRFLIHRTSLSDVRTKLAAICRTFHRTNPLQPGIQKQDLRGKIPVEIFDHALATSPELASEGEIVRLKSHKVVLKQDEQQARLAIEQAFETAGLSAPAVDDVLKASGVEPARARTILQMLLKENKLTRISDELVVPGSALANLRAQLCARRGQTFSVTTFKEWTGLSRKYAIPLLEFFDREHLTMRKGDERCITA